MSQPANQPTNPPPRRALTPRALVVGLLLLGVGALWIRQVELIVHTALIGEGTPAIPPLAGLLVLLAWSALARRVKPALAFTRAETLLVYYLLLLSVPISSMGHVRHLFPTLTVPFYFATPENHFDQTHPFIPPWFVPRDPEIVRTYWEGRDGGRVPWAAWGRPLAAWTLFFGAFLLTLLSLVALFRRPWRERERLTFPLVEMALDLTGSDSPSWGTRGGKGKEGKGREGGLSFFRNPLMWIGFGIAAVFNLTNILHALNPAVLALGPSFNLGALFTEPPLSGLAPLSLDHRPELVGLGYLMATDVALSAWMLFLLLRCEGLFARMMGYTTAGLPFDKEQGHGAFLALALILLWGARRHLQEAMANGLWLMAKDLRGGSRSSTINHQPSTINHGSSEPLPPRWAVAGLLVGGGILVAWSVAAGMDLTTALLYLGFVFAFALVYARIRAQTGLPASYMFPRDPLKMMTDMAGSSPLCPDGTLRSLTVLGYLTLLSRTSFQSFGGTQLESLHLAGELRLCRRDLLLGIALAVAVGFVLAYWTHLTAYYHYGANTIGGGTIEGDWRTRQARTQFEQIVGYAQAPARPSGLRGSFYLVGFLVALGLSAVRSRYYRFPLHPLGFAMACVYGPTQWWSFFLVWGSKTLILRLGGALLYRRLVPLFLGLALGHFFMAGTVWGLAGMIDETVARKYVIWFS